MPHYDLISCANDGALAVAVADRWLKALAARFNSRAPYCVALSGGRIAGKFLAVVSERARARNVPFDNVHFFWGDERCVPPTDADSNFLLAKTHLLDPLAIPPDRIHRIRGEISPDRAATEAEAEICRIAPMNAGGQPALDLIFLGMGEDGHVASLFPGAPTEVAGSKPVYRPVVAVKPPPQRITINFATLAAAREVWVLASGAGKETALRASLSPDGDTPLASVLAERDQTIIFTDIAL
jgi:6-phosphogluconolactonase